MIFYVELIPIPYFWKKLIRCGARVEKLPLKFSKHSVKFLQQDQPPLLRRRKM
jgi:hypothetical protein